ncbi:UroD [Desulforapulum autotrophicum HRM2]|jgi:uroporphyrinogen decarboxylase|uniref:UroD n=1 Tax=Desulforapulum autotrophicum (strain ATCC 43914 / DSM 3382 / VKM B-1955 / HRM2) TaxID=177437 RepID=C0QHC8_DESAH|nr:uroporphyrinogen decarboxylase family protein [Desulforapulum autotrophicum]ACN17787.1 UroD [Desulforapulum autotrophicum HRM2]
MQKMTGRERIMTVLNRKKADSLPWVPFAGVHSGFLTGYDADEVYQDSDKCFESLKKVNQLYKPDGQPIIFDLQLEAEILGCELLWAKDSPPTVITHPLADTKEIPTKIPSPAEGRLPMELDVMRRMKAEFGETTALYGLITGPFTLALHLRGTNIFMDMMTDAGYMHRLLNYCAEVAVTIAGYTLDTGMDVVALVDPMISQISPAHFEEYMALPFKRVFDYIRERGAKSSFFVCGNATQKLDAMCRTGCDSISVDENVDLAKAKRICDIHDVVLGGNIPLTTAMLFGTQQDNMKAVVDLIDSVETKHNLIIAPGCDMPYATPIENVLAAEQAVHNTASVREMVKNYEVTEAEFTGELPDYDNLDKPLVEVFTLDSVACAACTYMLAVGMDAQAEFGEEIDVVEHKYTLPENIARCRIMGVKQLPSIYINGELKHSSIIPSQQELFTEIREVL